NFTCLEVVFVLKRRLGYYLFHTYVPTCLIVIMSWVSFWIKPEAAPARVTLGVTSLLTLSTQHAKSQASLPPVSYLKAVDAFMSVCTIFVFMALMEYCLVNIVLGDTPPTKTTTDKGDKMYDLSSKGRNSVTRGSFGKRERDNSTDGGVPWIQRQENSMLLNAPLQPAPPATADATAGAEKPEPVKLTPAQIRLRRAINIDRFSRVFFPFLFTVLNCTYWYMFYEYL
uniref:Neurotransmitter-gated ion-channel transmembrane domain-containing protein n=1 Tax=Phlebotomus papatasi TaxID=29031 RepID=A0A1B0DHN4_PHLPP